MSREEEKSVKYLECKLLREHDEALRKAMTTAASIPDQIADVLWSKKVISKHAKSDVLEETSCRKKARTLLLTIHRTLECHQEIEKREEAFDNLMKVFMREDLTPLDKVANDINTEWKARKGESNGYASMSTPLHSDSRADGLLDVLSKHGISKEMAEESCTDDFLVHAALKIRDWYTLGAALGLDKDEEDDIRVDGKKESERRIMMLRRWKQKNGVRATNWKLLEELFECQEMDVLYKVCEVLSRSLLVDGDDESEAKEISKSDKEVEDKASVSSDGSGYISEDGVGFLCGCGNCSIADYCNNKCPLPNASQIFPFLNWKKLTQKDQLIIHNRLIKETRKVNIAFASMVRKIAESFSKRVDVQHLIVFVQNLGIYRPQDLESNKALLESRKEELRKADSVHKVFSILADYWSWFNYSLLQVVVDEFGCQADEDRLQCYINSSLKLFLKRAVFEIPIDSFGTRYNGDSKKLVLKVEDKWAKEARGENLAEILVQFSEILEMEPASFFLQEISKGCFQIVFLVPQVVEQDLFPLTLQQLFLLSQLITGLTEVWCGPHKQLLTFNVKHLEQQVLKSLPNKEVELCSLKNDLAEINAFDECRTLQVCSFLPVTSLDKSATVDEIADSLRSCWSWFNYELIEVIINQRKDIELKMLLQQYKKNVSSFLSQSISEILPLLKHRNRFLQSEFVKIKLISKVSLRLLTGIQLQRIKHNLAKAFMLEPYSMLLAAVESDYSELVFLLPGRVHRHCFPLNSGELNTLNSLLSEWNFSSFHVEDSDELNYVYELVDKSHVLLQLSEVPDIMSGYITDSESETSADSAFVSMSATSTSEGSVCLSTNEGESSADSGVFMLSAASSSGGSACLSTTEDTYDTSSQGNRDIELASSYAPSSVNEGIADTVTMGQINFEGELYIDAPNDQFESLSSEPLSLEDRSGTPESEPVEQRESKPLNEHKYTPSKFHPGILTICRECIIIYSADETLIFEVCKSPRIHEMVPLISAAWDKGLKKLVQIRPFPRVRLKGGFAKCNRWRCTERCTFAHSELEKQAWNYELTWRRKRDKPFTAPTVDVTLSSKSAEENDTSYMDRQRWRSKFEERLANTTLNEDMLESVLTPESYQEKFYNLLCFEEKQHINLLGYKCDSHHSKYELTLDRQIPYWLRKMYSYSVIGYLSGMTADQIAYATQASEGLYFVDHESSSDICRARILDVNYYRAEKKLYISVRHEDCKKLKERCKFDDGGSCLVHVQFEVKHSYFNNLHRAVINIPSFMISKLLPQEEFFVSVDEVCEIDAVCKENKRLSLDRSQLKAVKKIWLSSPSAPVLISGPFGSGKTTTLARAAFELVIDGLRTRRATRILVCAHHYATTDTYLNNLSFAFQHCPAQWKKVVKLVGIVRGKSPKSRATLVPEFQKDADEGKYDKQMFLVVVTTFTTSLHMFDALGSYFTHILLDEAAQVREPEAIAALGLGIRDAKIVLAGDTMQVGPADLVLDEEARNNELQTSLLERLDNAYKKIGGLALGHVHTLTNNYRCHEAITTFLSKLFYQDHGYKLRCNSQVPMHPRAWYPILFYCSHVDRHREQPVKEPAYEAEAQAVIGQISYYCLPWPQRWRRKSLRDVCVIAPTRPQVNLLRRKMHGRFSEVNVLPTYLIQGVECRAVFLSTSEPLENDGSSSNPTKSLCNPAVFNTAISRAESLVVAIGNPFSLLKIEEKIGGRCWKEYLTVCMKQTMQNRKAIFFPPNFTPFQRADLLKELAIELEMEPESLPSVPKSTHVHRRLHARKDRDALVSSDEEDS